MQPDNEKSLSEFIFKLGINISPSLVYRELVTHPDYPSILSFTDTLNYFGIPNTAVRIEKFQIKEVPLPFLAYLTTKGGTLIIIENTEHIESVYPGFYENWSSIVIAAETTKKWRHEENEEWLSQDKEDKNKRKLSFAILIFIAIITCAFTKIWNLQLLTIVSVFGIFNSWLIISKEHGVRNEMIEFLCGKNDNCDLIKHHESRRFFLNIGWSDINIIWFTSLLILLLSASSFAINDAYIINLISILATIAVPITFWSIYYQWRVEKKWCHLCLITVGLLWTQLLLLLPFLTKALSTLEIKAILYVSCILLSMSLIWFFIKKLLQDNKKLERGSLFYLRLKRNEYIFSSLLEKQKKVDIANWEGDFQLGDPQANLQIVVACSPYCMPCALTHMKLHHIIKKYGENTGIIIRFIVETNGKKDKRTEIVRYMLQVAQQNNVAENNFPQKEFLIQMLFDWFSLMDYNKFTLKYPLTEKNDVNEILLKNEEWINSSQIISTPTIFINGYEMPRLYTIDDLSRLLDNLIQSDEMILWHKDLGISDSGLNKKVLVE